MTLFRIVTGDAKGVRGIYEIEADYYAIEEVGTLKLFYRPAEEPAGHQMIVAHAPGTWRSIVNAELFEKAVKRHIGTLDENSRGRIPARPIQAV